MRTETEIREKLWELLAHNKEEMHKQRESSFPQMYEESISSRSGIIDGLAWSLGYKGSLDFIEQEVKAGRATVGPVLDAAIKEKA